MVNATSFPTSSGYQYLTNESNINIIRAAITPFVETMGGFPWVIAQSAIIFFVPIYIWQKSQNTLASGFGLLLITLFMRYYSIYTGWMPLNPFIQWGAIGLAAVLIASSLLMFYKRDQ